MSTPTPLDGGPSLVTFTIEVAGAAIASDIRVVSIDTWWSLGKIPRARLVIADGSAANGDFELSAGPTFVPGQPLSIAAGYDNQSPSELFRGVIVKQGLEISRNTHSKLVVEAADEAIRMTLDRKNGVFEKVTDSQLIEKLAKRNGLEAKVTSTQAVHEEVVQYYASDWDLAMTRAEINGLVVRVAHGELVVEPPDTQSDPVLAVTYGQSILDLETEMDATSQFDSSAIISASWDPTTQRLIEAGPGTVRVDEPGEITSEELAAVFKVKSFRQQTGGPVEEASLEAWSSAELLKSKLSKIRGRVRFRGSALAIPGATLELGGLGATFNGKAYMGAVHQHIRSGVWSTSVEIGLSARWFAADAPDVAAPGASGQLPPISGLQTAKVKQVAKDPEGEFRVQVALPLLGDDSQRVWARVATFYASSNVGAMFYPEVGDEVIVAFMNQDPRFPVILGSVYSKALPPPEAPDEDNTRKLVRTRGELELSFDDKDKVLSLSTPGGHRVELDDKATTLTVEDASGNRLVMAKSGITLKSPKNIDIKAGGTLTLDAGAKLTLTKTSATLDGATITAKASTKFSATANASAEVKSSGMLSLRGSIVNIN